jgi:HAE1 family hydrophobic/amphiphilic exporter-1
MMSAVSGGGPNTASITAYLDQDAEVAAVSEEIQSKTDGLLEYGYISVSGDGSDLGGFGGSSINLSIQGEDQDAVTQVTLQLLQEISSIDGLADVGADITNTITRLNIALDPQKMLASGLTAEQIELIQQEYMILITGGTLPGKTIAIEGRQYPVYVSAITGGLSGIEQAENLKIGFPLSVGLGQIADISIKEMPSHISRTDLSLSATITGNITVKDIGSINQIIQKKIDSLPDHPGVEIKTAGIAEQMQDSFNSMGIALIGAVVLAMLVMVLMMRSIRNPLIIMVSLPLASIGAMLGLLITGNTLSLFAMLGIVMLVGIVLTNAVVLISMIEDLRREGIPTRDAILESGRARLRPILMTALTTIFAMLPLAIGIGSGIMMTAELAVMMINGLVSSTALTLYVIPVIYSLVNRDKSKESKKV